jgi:hypothetical protein
MCERVLAQAKPIDIARRISLASSLPRRRFDDGTVFALDLDTIRCQVSKVWWSLWSGFSALVEWWV